MDRCVQRRRLIVALPPGAADLRTRVDGAVESDHGRPLVDQLARGLTGQVAVEHHLQPGEPVHVFVVEVRHERGAVASVQELHERPRGAVVGERLQISLILPDRERVLGAAVRLRDQVGGCLQRPPAEKRLDMAVPTHLEDRTRGEPVARHRDRVVGKALVDPRGFTRARPVLEQVLVLVGEDPLVLERLRRAVEAELG